MKLMRVVSRIAILLVVAAVFVKLTAMYGNSARILPYPRFPFSPYTPSALEQVEMRHQPAAPDVGYVTDFVGWGIWLAICGVIGRKGFRLRLNPARRGAGQPILLGLHRDGLASSASPTGLPPH